MVFYSRKNLRLPDFDYSQEGGYFITICTHNRKCILSSINNVGKCQRAEAILTRLGSVAETVLLDIADRYGVILDSYVIMPNHIHFIVFLQKECTSEMTVAKFVGALKSIVANQWVKECNAHGVKAGKLWQRNYFEHILRNERDYLEKREYINQNPDKWMMDDEYMEN